MHGTKTHIEVIADALREALVTADPSRVSVLANLIEDYAQKFPRTYISLRDGRATAVACYLFDAMVEGTDATPISPLSG